MPSDDRLRDPWASFLAELNEQLPRPTEVHCLGGFVVSELYGLERPTADVDILEATRGTDAATLARLAGRGSPLHKRHKIFYRNGAETWAVELTTTDTEFRVVGSELLFEEPYLNDPDGPGIGNANYDVSLDSQRFLMMAAAGDRPRGLVLVLNWTEELAPLLSAN